MARGSILIPALLGLCVALTSRAAGQTVQGELRDEERGQLIAGARLLLLDDAGSPVDSTFSDASGRFRLRAPAPGSYTLYFGMDGWAGVPSETLALRAGVTTAFDFRVPLIGSTALREMSDIMAAEPRLQRPLPELCGEPVRAWEAGILVGVVRARGTNEPVAGARVTATSGRDAPRSTVSNEQGIYYLCNVLAGPAVRVIARTADGRADSTRVEIRAGTAAWFDLTVPTRH